MLVTGGHPAISSCEIFDPNDTSNHPDGSWSTTDSLTDVRYRHTATLLTDGRVLVTGGNGVGNYNYISSCEIFDPSDTTNHPNGSWSATDSMTEARDNHTATLLADGRVLVTSGYDGSIGLSSCEIFDSLDTTSHPNGSWSVADSMTDARYCSKAILLTDGRILVTGSGYNNIFLSSCEIYTYTIPADATSPVVSNQSPADTATDVVVNTDIYLEIQDPLTTGESFSGVDRDSINVTIGGTPAIVAGVFDTTYCDGVIIPDEIGGFYCGQEGDAF